MKWLRSKALLSSLQTGLAARVFEGQMVGNKWTLSVNYFTSQSCCVYCITRRTGLYSKTN